MEKEKKAPARSTFFSAMDNEQETVNCPLHPENKLNVVVQDSKTVAICNCDVKRNNHKGQVVWERS